MKTILLLVITMVSFWCLTSKAQLIYANVFNGGGSVTVSGTAPTVANSSFGGSSGAQWICTTTNGVNATVFGNGTIDTNPGCALLPFTPQSGCVYFMSASVTLPTGMPNWVAMGFTSLATQTNNANGDYCRFTDNPPGGYAWMGMKADITQGVYAGRGTASPLGNTTVIPAGTNILTMVLNTVSSSWTVSAYLGGTIVGTNVVGGTQMGTNFTYGSNPAIAFAGIGQTGFAGQSVAGIQWNYWELTVTQVVASVNPVGYWAAPAASGTGDGSTSANAAGYQNASFWSTVQSQLQNSNVTVNFLSGTYNAGSLSFTNMGNPLHQLVLAAATPHGAVFSPTNTFSYIVYLGGCQNVQLNGFVFTGDVAYWGVYCIPNSLNPCRNININKCWFLNLTNAYYAAIGLLNGTRSVQVYNCNFTNITDNNGGHQHMIYAPHDIEDVVVSNCIAQDCLADYMRFRDDSEYVVVEDSTFISTMSATAFPFVSAELYNETNSDSAGDEFFGTYFQVSSNTFTYEASGGSGPYSALHFSDYGWSPESYYCDLTSLQATNLATNTTSYQQSFMQTNMGIIGSDIKMFGNTYNSRVAYHMDYTYEWDGSSPYNNWEGTVGLNNVPDTSGTPLGPVPVLRNGNFDKQGLLLTAISPGDDDNECRFRDWFCNPKYTDILSTPGFNGTTNALRFEGTTSQYVYQWITPPGPAWTLDFLFAIGSAYTGTGTKFKVDLFHNDIAGSKVSVGVNNSGQYGIYNGGTFTVLSGLGTIAFSVDSNGNGNYTDPGDTLNVYRVRVVGNYAAATPFVNIYTSDANSMVLDHQSLNQKYWVSGTPVSNQSAPETIAFYNYTAPVLVDQVALATGLGEQAPVITNTVVGGGKVILAGTNGFAGDNCYVLSTTNLTTPASNWTYEATNIFTGTAFTFTNTLTPGLAQKFYMLKIQ